MRSFNITLYNLFLKANQSYGFVTYFFLLYFEYHLIMIDYVCILAGGKGSRLYPLTHHIPKILVNLHNENILSKIIQFWKIYCKKFIIITNPEYLDLVEFYCKDYNDIQYELRSISVNNEENSYALKTCLTDLNGKSLLITWCDVFPAQDISPDIFSENIIFVNNFANYKSRYIADDTTQLLQKVKDHADGNVIGIYFVKDYHTLVNENDKQDFCDCFIQNYGSFKTHNIEVVDVGDKEKLNAYLEEQKHTFYTRFFNKITFISDTMLKKQSICQYGNQIIQKEIDFYKYLKTNKLNYPFPLFEEVSDTCFNIAYVKSESFYKKIYNSYDPRHIFDLLNYLKNLYETSPEKHVSNDDLKNDIEIETVLKISSRYNQVSQIIKPFEHIQYCNFIKIDSYEVIQQKLHERINHLLPRVSPVYRVIHGDLNLSNIMSTNPYTFIDPRGYYGNSKIFGLPYYDYAKIYFSLFGFDKFNGEDKYYFSIQDDNILPNITAIFKEIPLFLNLFTKEEYELILCISISIWLGLPFYCKDNLSKVVGSYFYARYLGTVFLQSVDDLVNARKATSHLFFNQVTAHVQSSDSDALLHVKQKTIKLNPQPYTYKNKIIKKPWGFEFVSFETKSIALLCLHMLKGKSTSLHCHEFKDSSFIVAQGKVRLHTLDSSFCLTVGDTCYIPRKKFHKIEALSENTIVLEFEIQQPNRNDLLRYRDDYNREDQGYEGINNMISDITSSERNEYFDFYLESHTPLEKRFQKSILMFQFDMKSVSMSDIFVILNGYLVLDGKYLGVGSFLRGEDIYEKGIQLYNDFCCMHFMYTE
jgi:choline kinase/mannose-6-phosphate isomerase-like protein (cupin superfamily)